MVISRKIWKKNTVKKILILLTLITPFYSSMGSSLSTMSAQSCLQQQRDAYPYMFHHDPLSSLASASYGRSCGAAQSAQSHMGGYGSSLSSTGGSQGAGIIFLKPYSTLLFINITGLHAQLFYFCILGVISHGLSVPLQVPGQPPDLTSNYWPRLQWTQLWWWLWRSK